ncbi:MAG: hypothetical protein L3J91_03645 [Thermoplasmata archaeon]|nr:hypothetical protein [Thermoplasmata archaeon]
MGPPRDASTLPERMGPPEVLRVVGLAGGVGLAVVAALLGFEGPGAVVPSGSLAPLAAPVLGVTGLAVAGLALALGGREALGRVRRALPQMYPFGAPHLQLVVYLLVLLGGAAVTHATFVTFTGADAQAAIESPTGPTPIDLLLSAGSLVLWGLAVYAVFGLRRFIQMGRAMDARRGTDPFDRGFGPREEDGARWIPPRRPAPPAVPGGPLAIGAVTAVLMVEISAGIQLLETPLGPAPAGVFWWSQLLTLAAAGVVSSLVVLIDRGVRDIETLYAPTGARPAGVSASAAPPPATGFVP